MSTKNPVLLVKSRREERGQRAVLACQKKVSQQRLLIENASRRQSSMFAMRQSLLRRQSCGDATGWQVTAIDTRLQQVEQHLRQAVVWMSQLQATLERLNAEHAEALKKWATAKESHTWVKKQLQLKEHVAASVREEVEDEEVAENRVAGLWVTDRRSTAATDADQLSGPGYSTAQYAEGHHRVHEISHSATSSWGSHRG
jgi:hypothetical protein